MMTSRRGDTRSNVIARKDLNTPPVEPLRVGKHVLEGFGDIYWQMMVGSKRGDYPAPAGES